MQRGIDMSPIRVILLALLCAAALASTVLGRQARADGPAEETGEVELE